MGKPDSNENREKQKTPGDSPPAHHSQDEAGMEQKKKDALELSTPPPPDCTFKPQLITPPPGSRKIDQTLPVTGTGGGTGTHRVPSPSTVTAKLYQDAEIRMARLELAKRKKKEEEEQQLRQRRTSTTPQAQRDAIGRLLDEPRKKAARQAVLVATITSQECSFKPQTGRPPSPLRKQPGNFLEREKDFMKKRLLKVERMKEEEMRKEATESTYTPKINTGRGSPRPMSPRRASSSSSSLDPGVGMKPGSARKTKELEESLYRVCLSADKEATRESGHEKAPRAPHSDKKAPAIGNHSLFSRLYEDGKANERRLQEKKDMMTKEAMESYTFRPTLVSRQSPLRAARSMPGNADMSTGVNRRARTPVFERLAMEANAIKDRQALLRKMKDEQELAGATFSPQFFTSKGKGGKGQKGKPLKETVGAARSE